MKTASLPAALVGLILAPFAWADAPVKPVLELKGHEGRVSAVAYNPAGTKIATAGADKIVRIWDAKTGNLLFKLQTHEQPVLSLAFPPEGTWLVSGSARGTDEGEVRVWELNHGKLLRTQLFPSPVKTLSYGEENAYLAGLADGQVFHRFACTGEDLATWKLKDASPVYVGFTPAKEFIAMSGGTTPKLWLKDSKPEMTFSGAHVYGAIVALPNPDGVTCVSAGVEEVRLWDRKTGKVLHRLPGLGGHVYAAAFTPDGKTLVVSHADCHADETKGEQAIELLLWDVKTGKRIAYFPEGQLPVIVSMAVSPDGKRVVTGGGRGEVQVWELGKREADRTIAVSFPLTGGATCCSARFHAFIIIVQ